MERGSLMLNTTTFVGLDVHARSIKAVALDAMTGEVRSATFGYDAAEVAGWVSSVDPSSTTMRTRFDTVWFRMLRTDASIVAPEL